LHTPVLGVLKNVYRFPCLNAAGRELLGMKATSAPSERVFSVPATMLRRPEPTKERVEPKTLGITAIEIQLNQVHSAMGVTTST